MISMIAAVGKGNELGYKGDLVWRLPEDLKRFKEVTKGHTVLMGHKTFDSLPKLLPKSPSLTYPDVHNQAT